MKSTILCGAAIAASLLTANAAISVTTGNFDSAATMQGATRFRSINTSSSQQEVYLANTVAALGTANRAQMDLTWNSGATFKFGWDPSNDKIFTEVTTTANGTKRIERAFTDPVASLLPNFILIAGRDSTPLNSLILTLTDLDGNALSSSLTATSAISQLSITDGTLLKDGFVLSGRLNYTGTPNNNEGDRFEIAFGHSDLVPVPEPSTYFAAALLLVPVVAQIRRSSRSK